MAQALRGLRWRAAGMVALILVILLWRVLSPRGGRHVVQVHFEMAPALEGAVVLIDGDRAGTLEKRGARTLTGFRVDEGEHVVSVGMEGCPGRPARVTTGFGAAVVVLVAEMEVRHEGEETICQVMLHP